MKVVVANVLQNPEHAPLVHQFLRLRRAIFVERLSWPLDVQDGLEFEQYDILPLAYYVLATVDGVLVGGARLLRCDAASGTGTVRYSYMIRDAWRGLIELPQRICTSEPPTRSDCWEFTRFAVVGKDPAIAPTILAATQEFLAAHNAEECLFLGSPAFLRVAKKHGFQPEALGPVCANSDGRFVAFRCQFRTKKLPKRDSPSPYSSLNCFA